MNARPPGTPYRLREMASAFGTAASNLRAQTSELENSSAGLPANWGWSGRAAGTYRRTWQTWKTVADGVADLMDSARGTRQVLNQLADELEAAQRAWDDALSMAQGMGYGVDANGYAVPRSVAPPAPPPPGSPEGQIEDALHRASQLGQQAFDTARETLTEIQGRRWNYDLIGQINWLLGMEGTPLAVQAAITAPGSVVSYVRSVRNLPGLASRLFDEEFVPVANAYLRDEATVEDLDEAARLSRLRIGAAWAFTVKADWDGVLRGGVRAGGVLDVVGKLALPLGIASDVMTIYNPGNGPQWEQNLNKDAAIVNLVGSGAVIAGMAANAGLMGAAGGILVADASLGWIPVAGQVLVVGSGLVLAGIWAYDNIQPFHDFCNAVGSETAHVAGEAWNAVTNTVSSEVSSVTQTVSDVTHTVSNVTHTVGNAVNAVGGAAHAVTSFFHWP